MDHIHSEPFAEKRLTEDQLLVEVRRHRDGMDPTKLLSAFVAQGYSPHTVQRAVHQALDKGLVELGDRLSLRAALVP